MKRIWGGVYSSCLALAAGMPLAAHAQDNQTARTQQDTTGALVADNGSGDIIVTAQRREQRLQDVPIAVQAVSAEQTQRLGISDPSSLQIAVPSLDFRTQNGGAIPYIRGVGTNSVNVGNESPVAVYIDGVYQTSLSASIFSFNNIQRIEVLKGPQGTLFGRNSSGGVIQIITRDPSFKPTFHGEIGYGNYDLVQGSIYASTALSESAAIDLAVVGRHQGDGFSRNTTTGLEQQRPREIAARSRLLLNLGSDTQVRIAGSYARVRGRDNALVLADGAAGFDGVGQTGFRTPRGNGPESSGNENVGASVTIDHDFGGAKFKSISAYQWTRGTAEVDLDATAINLLNSDRISTARSYSQELQLYGESSGVQWIVGAFYLDSRDATDRSRLTGLAVAPRAFLDRVGAQTTKSVAAFGQGTLALGERTNFTAGIRYTTDKRSVTGFTLLPTGPLPTIENSRRDNKVTWRFALDHHFTDTVMAYASISRGFKSGLYNTVAPAQGAVLPEVLDAYEAGIKMEFLDRHLRLNLSGFYYDYQNIQLDSFQGGTVITINAAKATIKGLEAELDFRATPRLRVTGGITLLDGNYDSFPNAPQYIPRAAGGNNQVIGDASGQSTVRTPDVSLSVAAFYDMPTAIGDFNLTGSYSYNSGYNFFVLSNTRQDSFQVVNASIRWTPTNRALYVQLWAKNLFSEKYYDNLTAFTFATVGSAAAPRTYGLTVGVDF